MTPRMRSRRRSSSWRGEPGDPQAVLCVEWLFGVARRPAARIRMEEARRRRYESRSAERASALIAARQRPADPDPYPELHAEIERLPEDYRLPVLLCYFEGLSHEQAASRSLARRDREDPAVSRPRAAPLAARAAWRARSCSCCPPGRTGRGSRPKYPSVSLNTITRGVPVHDDRPARRGYFLNRPRGDPGGDENHADQQAEIGGGGVRPVPPRPRRRGRGPASDVEGPGRSPDAAVAEAGDAGSILRLPGGDAGRTTHRPSCSSQAPPTTTRRP